MKSIKLGRKVINNFSEPYIIAEIGVNHECSLKLAKRRINIVNERNGNHNDCYS